MRVFKYLIGLWTGMAVYSVLSLLSGPSGLSAYGQLEAERERQLVNMRELGAINEKLENTKNSLLYDQDTVAVHARRLGYAGEDEHFVRIVGMGTDQNPYVAAGQVYFAAAPEFMADKTIKIIATCAGMAVFALFFILELLRTDNKG
ncbi:MAG: septum formation initiator family protein [Treponema sp.]|nr:septum formation initiator family protein [Treponema sp.]